MGGGLESRCVGGVCGADDIILNALPHEKLIRESASISSFT